MITMPDGACNRKPPVKADPYQVSSDKEEVKDLTLSGLPRQAPSGLVDAMMHCQCSAIGSRAWHGLTT
jgi:hypothetical protein